MRKTPGMQKRAGVQGPTESARAKAMGHSPGREDDLSVVRSKVGELLDRGDEHRAALERFRPSVAITKRVPVADPSNAGWRDLFISRNETGDVLHSQGNLLAALDSYRASLAIAKRLAATDPGNARWDGLFISYGKIGDVLRSQGNLRAALEKYRASLTMAERLAAADPGSARWHDLSISHEKIGDVLRRQGNVPKALESYRASLLMAERLAVADPGNAGWQRAVSMSHKIGLVLLSQGDLRAALESLRASFVIAQRLPTHPAMRSRFPPYIDLMADLIVDLESRVDREEEAISKGKQSKKSLSHGEIPTKAPRLWRGARKEVVNPKQFVEEVYGRAIEAGMTQVDLKRLDGKLYVAFHNWCKRHGVPPQSVVPSSETDVDRVVAEFGRTPTHAEALAALRTGTPEGLAVWKAYSALAVRRTRGKAKGSALG